MTSIHRTPSRPSRTSHQPHQPHQRHQRHQRRRAVATAFAATAVVTIAAVGCAGTDTDTAAEPTGSALTSITAASIPTSATEPPAPATTVVVPTTVTPAPTTVVETTPPTTAAPTTTVPSFVETREIGTSVEGRPINAVRRGTAGGRVVLVVGVIHGDEDDGVAILDLLEQYEVPAGVDLWLVESMNPDGQAAQDRHNANQVDLNRNFPAGWGPIGVPGDGQYAGPSEASEPETQAMIAFVDEIRPDLVIWYHQDLFRINPGKGRDGAIRQRYAELVGLPLVSITGGTYTGVAATWVRRTIEPGVSFIVELGATLSPDEADVHARAVLTVASEPN